MLLHRQFAMFYGENAGRKTCIFLLFLAVTLAGQSLILTGLKFITFELSGSKSLVSLIGAVSAVAFISLGLVAGIIVDIYSKKFFINLQLVVVGMSALVLFVVFLIDLGAVWIVMLFLLMHELLSTLASAAKNRVFYDLCGTDRLAVWISRRGMVLAAAPMAASLILSVFVGREVFLFLLYGSLLFIALGLFKLIGYSDSRESQNLRSVKETSLFVSERFKEFVALCYSNKILLFLLLASFTKTFFIFWPMSSGALFKFGIEDEATKRLYLYTAVGMDFITIFSMYILGKAADVFSLRTFILGVLVSGLGVFLFGLSESVIANIVFLGMLYVGLAISGISSGYILRTELPDKFLTQGLSFSVVPYYLADIFSGVAFASMLVFFSVDTLLIFAGAALLLLSVASLIPLRRVASHSV